MTPPLPPTPDLADIVAGGLILLRVSTMTMFLPVLGHQLVPSQVKIGLMALIAMLMYPVARPLTPAIPPSPVALAVLAGQESFWAACWPCWRNWFGPPCNWPDN